MTETVLREIVHRAVRDGSYRAQLQSDPAGALAGYALNPDERAALTSGDAAKLTALGIDQRMSKAFTTDVLGGVVSKVIAYDAGTGEAAIVDEAPTRSFNWRTEQNLDTFAPDAAEAVLDEPKMERSFNWTTEQNIDTARALDAEAEGTPAAIVDGPAPERSFNWMTEQNLDGGDSLKTVDWPGEDHQTASDTGTADAPADGNTLTEY